VSAHYHNLAIGPNIYCKHSTSNLALLDKSISATLPALFLNRRHIDARNMLTSTPIVLAFHIYHNANRPGQRALHAAGATTRSTACAVPRIAPLDHCRRQCAHRYLSLQTTHNPDTSMDDQHTRYISTAINAITPLLYATGYHLTPTDTQSGVAGNRAWQTLLSLLFLIWHTSLWQQRTYSAVTIHRKNLTSRCNDPGTTVTTRVDYFRTLHTAITAASIPLLLSMTVQPPIPRPRLRTTLTTTTGQFNVNPRPLWIRHPYPGHLIIFVANVNTSFGPPWLTLVLTAAHHLYAAVVIVLRQLSNSTTLTTLRLPIYTWRLPRLRVHHLVLNLPRRLCYNTLNNNRQPITWDHTLSTSASTLLDAELGVVACLISATRNHARSRPSMGPVSPFRSLESYAASPQPASGLLPGLPAYCCLLILTHQSLGFSLVTSLRRSRWGRRQ
jgi:hypothetical protein